MYDVQYLNPAEKYLKKIKDKNLLAAFKTAIDELKKNPYIGSLKVQDLSGIYCYDVRYAKVDYEIAYRIYEEENNNLIVIMLVGTRENFYEDLKRLNRS
jgi:mRNA interferase RelE/StbE